MSRSKVTRRALVALGPVVLAALAGGQVQEPKAEDSMALLRHLAAAPRIVGTPGYEAALERIASVLEAAELEFERGTAQAPRGIPTVSDVLLFEDGVAESAFAGLRERWRADAKEGLPRPAAYDWNATADVRGQVVDVLGGETADIELRKAQRVELKGAVWLVAVPRTPAHRSSSIETIWARAQKAGAAGLLVAPLQRDGGAAQGDFVLEARSSGDAVRARKIPAAPIRSAEADAIRERLRVKRVRTDEGAASIRVGPGPVEAQVRVVCKTETIERAGTLTCTIPGETHLGIEIIHVPIDEQPGGPLGGAALVAAAMRSLLQAVDAPDSGPGAALRPHRRYIFGPALSRDLADEGIVRLGAVLAPGDLGDRGGQVMTSTRTLRVERARIPAVLGETVDELDRRLHGTLAKRLDAAATLIAYASVRALDRAPDSILKTLDVPD